MDDRIIGKTKVITEVSKLSEIWSNRSAYIKRYLWPLPKFRREVVVMVDGKMTHGGLTDRLRNILSIYSYCKTNGIHFKVYYTYPTLLTEYLLPQNYDWRISAKEISNHFLDSKEMALYVKELPGTGEWKSSRAKEYNDNWHLTVLNQEFAKRRHCQYHLYGNAYFAQGYYKPLFEELFRPSAYLASRLNLLRKGMMEPYESVTLRFQSLLGDLKEGDNVVLTDSGREELINRCIEKLDELWKSHYFSTSKVLVTSDSSLFISRISEKDYVYTIPGKMEHMDYTDNSDIEMNAKPFMDLFLLKDARKLTLLRTGRMYKSGFPAFAAELGDKPYEVINF